MKFYSDIKPLIDYRTERWHTSRFVLSLLLSILIFIPAVAWAKEAATIAEIKGLYQSGNYNAVVEALSDIKEEEWVASQSLYLGLSHLRLGNKGKAIDAWQRYVRLDHGGEGSRKISRYLTILIQQKAKENAKQAVAQEKSLSTRLDQQAIAVSLFQNLGTEKYSPLSKGLAEMMITDLSQVKGLTVVERIQIQAVLNELKLSKSGLVDKKSAPRVGKLVGAGRITTGTFIDLVGDEMRLDAAVTKTESGQLLSSPDASGPLNSFYQLEKTLVFKILCGIGRCPESLDSRTRIAVEKVHTKNFKAFQHYSEGLDLADQGKYREASRAFFLALEEDPKFGLARKALLETPIVNLDLAAMVSGGESVSEKGLPIIDFKAITASAKVGTFAPKAAPSNEKKASSPELIELSESSLPVPLIPQIAQQPVGNGTGTSAGAGTTPVQIQIQLP